MSTAIIMSVYQGEDPRHLEAAMASIVQQTCRDWQLLVMQDGPLPPALAIVLERMSNEDKRISIFRSDVNRGLAASLNHLIDVCLGMKSVEFIARMDSDDISMPDRLQKQVSFMEAKPHIDICGGACSEFGATFAKPLKLMPLTDEDIKSSIFRRCPFVHPTVMFRKKIFASGLRYPEKTRFSEDIGLWFEVFTRGYRAANLGSVLLRFRTSEEMMFRRRGFGKASSELMIRLKYMKRMRQVTLKNIALSILSFQVRLLPEPVLKVIYKYCR